MKRERRHFDKEFKQMAVNLCLAGKPTREVADELGVRRELVARWKREYSQYKEGSFSGHGKANLTDAQNVRANLCKLSVAFDKPFIFFVIIAERHYLFN